MAPGDGGAGKPAKPAITRSKAADDGDNAGASCCGCCTCCCCCCTPSSSTFLCLPRCVCLGLAGAAALAATDTPLATKAVGPSATSRGLPANTRPSPPSAPAGAVLGTSDARRTNTVVHEGCGMLCDAKASACVALCTPSAWPVSSGEGRVCVAALVLMGDAWLPVDVVLRMIGAMLVPLASGRSVGRPLCLASGGSCVCSPSYCAVTVPSAALTATCFRVPQPACVHL